MNDFLYHNMALVLATYQAMFPTVPMDSSEGRYCLEAVRKHLIATYANAWVQSWKGL